MPNPDNARAQSAFWPAFAHYRGLGYSEPSAENMAGMTVSLVIAGGGPNSGNGQPLSRDHVQLREALRCEPRHAQLHTFLTDNDLTI